MLHTVCVKDFMVRDFVKLSPDDDMYHAVQVLAHKEIPAAVVVDKKEKLVGILSETDCMRVVLDASYNERPPGTVEQYMTTNMDTIDVEATLIDTATVFRDKTYRLYPVLDHGRLVGIVTRRRVLRATEPFFERFKNVQRGS
ncbi:CBS domain-containing protein [Terasakiella sp. A23]|uniref:CBS domain-containing protein n=1 Tax=Terasakiella sp. FCG-A23 TaxID=3080561 RepID=UPI0029533EB5|nr:CBS domain-containing protein [Terasakiella sp. A23]MDV7338827.1 CBS domain-containing protein [Terasakiella sp. A23]